MGDVHDRGNSRQPAWYCRYMDLDGKRKHRPTQAPTREAALHFLAEVEQRVANGQIGIPLSAADSARPASIGLTLERLSTLYLAQAAPRSKDPERYRSLLRWMLNRHIMPQLGAFSLPAVQTEDLERLCEQRLAMGYKVSTVNAMVRAVSVLFSWARRRGLFSGPNPTLGLRRPELPREVDFFSIGEIGRLLNVAQRDGFSIYALLSTALYTGMRKGELFGLRWSDVCMKQAMIFVRRSYNSSPKSGRWRAVPVHPDLKSTLSRWGTIRQHPELVFPVRGRMGTSHDMCGILSLLDAAKVRFVSRPWHAMRHTFASQYVMSGGNLLALQRILGHARFEMTQIYSHLSPGFMADEIRRLCYAPPKPAMGEPGKTQASRARRITG